MATASLRGIGWTYDAVGVALIRRRFVRYRGTLALGAACVIVGLALAGCGPASLLSAGGPFEAPYVQGKGAGSPDLPLSQDLRVGLVYVPGSKDEPTTLAVYRQLLSEEGFPYEQVDAGSLELYTPQSLRKRFVALVLPEDVNRTLTRDFGRLVERYVSEAGGRALIVYDAGIQDESGKAGSQWLFSALTGIEGLYSREPPVGDEVPSASGRYLGPWVIPKSSPLRRYFEDGVMSGNTAKIHAIPVVQEYHWQLQGVEAQALAYGREGSTSPEDAIVTYKSYPGGGAVMYINGRPGSLKIRGNNDFMMRGPLKYFLIEVARTPRLVASPGGIGGLVLNIHVCSGAYFKDLDRIFKKEMLSRDIPFSFSVTAGPDTDSPGDGKGFDALNPKKGLPYLSKMAQYGRIGAHGGWIHNYWAYHFNEIPAEKKKEYIDENFETLAKATGVRVTEYAAPGGIHSAAVSDFIAAQGVRGASIPTAFCAPPTHLWTDGKLEDRFWLFGYTGTQYGMAFENMLANGRPVRNIEDDLRSIIDTVAGRREIRLFYSHPISIAAHPDMWKAVQDYVLAEVGSGDLTVRTVTDFADFLDRHRKVKFTVERCQDGYRVRAESSESMAEMTFAVPVAQDARVKDSGGFPVREKDGWAYLTIDRALVQVEAHLVIGK